MSSTPAAPDRDPAAPASDRSRLTGAVGFDRFYRETREDLLLQTYALTGSLRTAHDAVRDAYVVAWHHWAKAIARPQPADYVREHAWRQAQRRHAARLWQRGDEQLDHDRAATLEALGTLTTSQRKALILAHASTVQPQQRAREIGIPHDEAERLLELAVTEFSLAREISAADIGTALDRLRAGFEDVRWSRAPILRRSGAKRRRTHTALGVLAAAVAFVTGGVLVTNPEGVRPQLDRESTDLAQSGNLAAEPEEVLPTEALLGAAQVTAALGRRDGVGWTERETNDNSAGTGLVLPCQQQRYADPDGTAAMVRSFRVEPAGASTPKQRRGAQDSQLLTKQQRTQLRAAPVAVQFTEASADVGAARRAYQTAVDWFAGCTDARAQLLATNTVRPVGDKAIQFVMRSWARPARTQVVNVARTGIYTTVTVNTDPDADGEPALEPDVSSDARLLAEAVNSLCELEDAGKCAGATPKPSATSAVPAGEAPALLSELDLPAVSDVNQPWVGTDPERAANNVAATRCDETSFAGRYQGARIKNNLTRTYLIPEADLPPEFGITETAASMPVEQAEAFVGEVRDKLGTCARRDLGTEVDPGPRFDEGDRQLSVWHLVTEVSDQKSFQYSMAIMRQGNAVAQLSFVSAPGAELDRATFEQLAERAQDRLSQLRGPGKARQPSPGPESPSASPSATP